MKKLLALSLLAFGIYGGNCTLLAEDNSQQTASFSFAIKESLPLEATDPFAITNITFSPDGRYVTAFFNGDRSLRIFEADTGKKLATLDAEILFGPKNC